MSLGHWGPKGHHYCLAAPSPRREELSLRKSKPRTPSANHTLTGIEGNDTRGNSLKSENQMMSLRSSTWAGRENPVAVYVLLTDIQLGSPSAPPKRLLQSRFPS
jgi:hypothetical protein